MSSSTKVIVTAEDIELAKQRDSGHCMIADAVQRVRPHATDILVDLQSIRWTNRTLGKRMIALTPSRVQSALIRFDQGMKLAPFAFTIETAQTVDVAKRGEKSKVRKRKARARVSGGHVQVHGGAEMASKPAKSGAPNITMSNARGRVRAYGLRQLEP